ncbi:MAG TPA: hypothetical protein PLN85_05150 [archaeon]|nr:hypothetical protein [archaeon]HRT02445.1 hypothetical protein [Candidatus Diapherotrites archaeon]
MGIKVFFKNILNIFTKNKNKEEQNDNNNIKTQHINSTNYYTQTTQAIENKNNTQQENLLNQKENQLIQNYEKIDNTKIIDSFEINQQGITTIWDILKIKENTQAEHIIKSIPTDRWIDMDEIKHNIKLQFNVEYLNDKSLYPYLKTLTDINLIKINNTGKKRTWKKNIIIINTNNEKEK